MLPIKMVFNSYLSMKQTYQYVPGQNTTPSLKAVREEIPKFFREILLRNGYEPNDYLVYSSVGQPNRSFAKIPWVAIFKKSITRTATKGFYIVLLLQKICR
ncbi:DUF3578 domain-containing protein [Massilia glaciei]|uniref:DUF3578 domain-containing protein n=1 Tax=Massilia glaciei TaxID=1524097 RepID=A0A2U2HFH9_9BURK|nr:DUF3578 domain-containing protein [Massilia glaciei]